MYYDLIASLPHLPHFQSAEHCPITPLRLRQRLGLLRRGDAESLHRVWPFVQLRSDGSAIESDHVIAKRYRLLVESPIPTPLRGYLDYRMTQQTLLAALRRKQAAMGPPATALFADPSSPIHQIYWNWDKPVFGLSNVYPWLTGASDRLASGDALGLEQAMAELNWRWLGRMAEQSVFGFAAVVAYVFKWDLLRSWLANDSAEAKQRFQNLIDRVTHVAD
ncbi:DUF2764 family protein [Crateriforma conspicua]|uniref:Uncharacterized protein n=1 Tax=Crateriforma conspicua TaxID=2527996 RepID=A0A5C5Y485_9PLAN|nr:DUF2764 family protein [Crateriforma conspicua]QDV64587.1 hypothetical protein Mal65_37470 [Crateriforma conspicua]TWT69984.1 hypothetical protein Pan14r_22810 [Crateriforma conspicua]